MTAQPIERTAALRQGRRPTRPMDAAHSPTFTSLGVPVPLTAALATAGIDAPFPIQAAVLPDALAGADILGRGRTGSGKTLGFCIPLAARLAGGHTSAGRPRGLVLVPTRELANQVQDVLRPLAKTAGLSVATIFGGCGTRSACHGKPGNRPRRSRHVRQLPRPAQALAHAGQTRSGFCSASMSRTSMTFWNAWRPLADVRLANPTTCRGDSQLPTSRIRTAMPITSPSRSSTIVVDHLCPKLLTAAEGAAGSEHRCTSVLCGREWDSGGRPVWQYTRLPIAAADSRSQDNKVSGAPSEAIPVPKRQPAHPGRYRCQG